MGFGRYQGTFIRCGQLTLSVNRNVKMVTIGRYPVKSPFVTVLIPTRERCETLAATIRTCVEQNYDAMEIVVSDNCSSDHTEEVVRSFADPRIKYLNTGRRRSMTGNFEFALADVRPGYVLSIGDDDGLMPNAISQAAELIAETGFAAVTSSSIYYAWPSFPIEELRSTMVVRDVRRGVEIRNARKEASQRIKCCGEEKYYVWGLPSVYRGFVSTSVIDCARKNGRYFQSITPDAYSAFVNSFFIDKYLYSQYPFTIEGVSGKSNGASQLIGKDAAEEQKYLAENDIPFSDELVYTPSAPIIMAEAFLQAKRQFPDRAKGYVFQIEMVCQSARRYALGDNAAKVHQAVEQILKMHGKKEKPEPLRSWFYRLSHMILDAYRTVQFNCAQFGVTDVHQASLFAHQALQDRRACSWHERVRIIEGKILKRISHGQFG